MKEKTYYVNGMHCASCEILIENKLLQIPGVKSVDASTKKGRVVMECDGGHPASETLSELFKKENYRFADEPQRTAPETGAKPNRVKVVIIAALIITGFLLFNALNLGKYVAVSIATTLPMFFVFGLLAGTSSCAALIGGIVLSMAKQWNGLYDHHDSSFKKLHPHIMFNAGRLVSFAIFGALLGALGGVLKLSVGFTAMLTIVVSLIMLALAFQMMGVRSFQKFQIALPKFITRSVADEKKFKGRSMPFVMGALTFFLPCGFTLTAQSIALLSGSLWTGGLIMLFFAFGTAPILLLIGLSSIHFSKKPNWSASFLKVAGIILLFFSLYNINSQLNVLGVTSASDLRRSRQPVASALPTIVDGEQLVQMTVYAADYSPSHLRVKAGIPIRWEIYDNGSTGCTSVLISRDLLKQPVYLQRGELSVAQVPSLAPGKYKFSCSMGMVTGVMEAVN